MCTLGARRISKHFLIFKNRDRLETLHTRIILEEGRTKKILAVDEKGHCEGLNQHGIGFVESSLNPRSSMKYKLVSDIGREILNKDNIDDAIKVIEKENISGNLIISDGSRAYIVERAPDGFSATRIMEQGAITNHSIRLDSGNRPKEKNDYESSRERLSRAKELVRGIRNRKDIEGFLSDRHGKHSIYNEHTLCSYIIDPMKREIVFYKSRPDRTKPETTRINS